MRAIVIGGFSDAGGYIITIEGGKLVIKPYPGWGTEQFAEVGAALNIIREATRLKAPNLSEAAVKSVWDFTQKQLDQHLQGNSVLVI